MIRRHHVLSHGPERDAQVMVGVTTEWMNSHPWCGTIVHVGATDADYTKAGLPIPPKDSTGNEQADKLRGQVYSDALIAAQAYPAAAPFIGVGLLVFEGWIRFGAFLSGESKDDQKYQDQAKIGINDFLIRGFVPRKWVTDVEFAADYAHYLGQQINALTMYTIGDTFVPELCTDFGLTIMELIKNPAISDRIKKGNASPFSGGVPDPSWRYGIYDSYPDSDLLGLVAAVRFGGDVATQQARARTMVSNLRTITWPTDPNDQAKLAANVTAFAWHALGGRSRGYFLSASGARVDPSSGGIYKGPSNTPIEVMAKAPWVRAVNVDFNPPDPPVFFASWWSKTILGAGALFAGWKFWPQIRSLFP